MGLLSGLPHKVDVLRRRVNRRGVMGDEVEWELLRGRVEAWVQPAGEREERVAMKRGVSVTHKVYFREDLGLNETNALGYNGKVYEVRTYADPDAGAGLGVLYRVMVEEVYR